MSDKTASVIGAGSWGTAIAQIIAFQGSPVHLWARKPELVEEINTQRTNQKYLGDVSLHPAIQATNSLATAMQSDYLFLVTPAQSMRFVLADMAQHIRPGHRVILCSKGIETETCLLMSEVTRQILPDTPVAVLTGPNFAHEIARGKPAATTIACENDQIARNIQRFIAIPHFRPYASHDVIGAQIAGALKNVIAIACGISKGLNMGDSANASLVTRGLAEISRLSVAMGGQQETILGLCGVGDMMLTCSSEQSRNFSLGLALGRGQSLAEIMSGRHNVTEGVHTAKSAVKLAEKHGVELPISMSVHKCLNEGLSLDEVLQELLNRPIGYELQEGVNL